MIDERSPMKGAAMRDVYVDSKGKLWRVVAILGEPVVTLQEIESSTPASPVIIKADEGDNVVWQRFRRIYREGGER